MQLSDNITRFHYAAVLAHKLDNDTLAWMEASVHIPETVYKEVLEACRRPATLRAM